MELIFYVPQVRYLFAGGLLRCLFKGSTHQKVGQNQEIFIATTGASFDCCHNYQGHNLIVAIHLFWHFKN